MTLLNLGLWVVGIVCVVAGVAGARDPYRRAQALRAQEENIRRYENWRGRSSAAAGEGPSGAEVLQAELRRRAQLWIGLAVVGVVFVIAGFAVR